MDIVTSLASQRAVVIFSKSSCYMCYAIKRLFSDLGVNVSVHELDQDPNGKEMERVLINLFCQNPLIPAVFIGGKFIRYIEKVISLHLSGELLILLRNAGAIWL
ncbi:putative thioredoxin-disulfide reductase [Dioscorea sansibarensis]